MSRREKLNLMVSRWISQYKAINPHQYMIFLRKVGFPFDKSVLIMRKIVKRDNQEDFLDIVVEDLSHIYANPCYAPPKKRILIGSHSKAQWQAKKEQYNHKCFYCGCATERLTKDHVIPVAKGGNNSIDNIVPACINCNQIKHTKSVDVFKLGLIL